MSERRRLEKTDTPCVYKFGPSWRVAYPDEDGVYRLKVFATERAAKGFRAAMQQKRLNALIQRDNRRVLEAVKQAMATTRPSPDETFSKLREAVTD